MIEVPAIQIIGPETARSSISSNGIRTQKIYDRLDTLGMYQRWELDRDLAYALKDRDGRSVLEMAMDIATTKNGISIVDAGCGTGNTLQEIREQLAFRTHVDPANIKTLGISLEDYSKESANPLTRQAITNGEIEYVVADLESVELPEASKDLIFFKQSLVHNSPEKITKIIQNILPALRADGIMVFDITVIQRITPVLNNFLRKGMENGFVFSDKLLRSDWVSIGDIRPTPKK